MDIEQFRKAGYQAIDRICDYYYNLQSKPVVSSVEPGYLRECLPAEPPQKGENFDDIADDYQKLIIPGLTHWQHPSFFAYFPTACTFEGMIADLYASSTANPGFNVSGNFMIEDAVFNPSLQWSASPACTELEAVMMDWAAQLLGLSPEFYNTSGMGGGAIQVRGYLASDVESNQTHQPQSTASDSALIAVVAARSLYQRKHPEAELQELVIYTTSQTHSLGLKAGMVLGLSVRVIDVTWNDHFSLRGDTLRSALEEDKVNGKKPFILLATVGTTSSGAIDNLPEIGAIAKEHPDLWVHIDSAWAGVALSCPEYREALHLEAINDYAHSFCTNFHKWGLTNFDASTLWVRDRKYLTEALDVTPPFLRTAHGDAGTVIDYRNWHLGLGRRFRALKLWFVLRSFGVQGFQDYIRRTIKLNALFASLVKSSDQLAIVTPPSLSLTVFHLNPKSVATHTESAARDSLNSLNKIFYGRISARNDILLTSTVLNGIFCIRFAVGSARTEESHIHAAYDLLCKEGQAAVDLWEQTTGEQAVQRL
ncbi:hypothetical protein HGRIS_002393 [Hohenbuehelia grisea]|uniref:Aromatic-L-amino-acid decarboxylase n=1 Tax=Hohenbuehelia grisea TaxID=104357 RepID=A0ABR3JKC2_9AGAR